MPRKVKFIKTASVICTYTLLVGLSTSTPSHAMSEYLMNGVSQQQSSKKSIVVNTIGSNIAENYNQSNNKENDGNGSQENTNQEDSKQENNKQENNNQENIDQGNDNQENNDQDDNNQGNENQENNDQDDNNQGNENQENDNQDNNDQEDNTEEEQAPIYTAVKDTVYIKKKCNVYEGPDTSSKKIGTAILYKKYTRIGIGDNGYDQIKFDGVVAYIKANNLTTKKPTVPTDIVSITDKKYDYEDMKKDIKQLEKYYPDYVSVQSIGKTSDNREIYCAILGNPNAKKHILVQGSMHAREYINTQLLMSQLEYYLTKYEKGTYNGVTYKKMFNEVAVHIIPMVNPDGVTLSQYGLNGIQDKKLVIALKTMQKSSNFTRWKANAKGVDLNRNFSFGWTKKTGALKRGSMGYAGDKAESELETKALVKYTKSIKGLKTVLSYHSMGNIIYWDYGQAGKLMSQCKELVNLVQDITGYSLVTLNSKSISYGGYSDYVVRELGIPAVTLETGMIYAPVSHSQFGTIWKQNKTIIPAVVLQVIEGDN